MSAARRGFQEQVRIRLRFRHRETLVGQKRIVARVEDQRRHVDLRQVPARTCLRIIILRIAEPVQPRRVPVVELQETADAPDSGQVDLAGEMHRVFASTLAIRVLRNRC